MLEATTKPVQKHSYTVPCSSEFRNAVLKLAQKKKCNVADLARSMALVVPLAVINAYPDPGGPELGDRESVELKSGSSKGKLWRRKPRLQVRMAPDFAIETIRKALSLAMDIDLGQMCVAVESEYKKQKSLQKQNAQESLLREVDVSLRKSHDDHDRLQTVVKSLYFEPLDEGVHTPEQALYVLGFAPGLYPDSGALRQRFRRLATVYHPDGKNGCHQRMSQLNAAMELLR